MMYTMGCGRFMLSYCYYRVIAILIFTMTVNVLNVSSLSPSSSACKSFRLSGISQSSMQHLKGTYSRLPSKHNCNGKQIFRKGSYHIYFTPDFTGNGSWVVGNSECNVTDIPYLVIPSEADYLEDLDSETWQENGTLNEDLTVKCTEDVCNQIDVDDTSRWSESYEGIYYSQSSRCHNRATYYNSGSSNYYIYYMIEAEDWRGWVIGKNRCSEDYILAVRSDAWSPGNIHAVWEERKSHYFTLPIYYWEYNYDITFKCQELPAESGDSCRSWRGASIGLICTTIALLISLLMVIVMYEVKKVKRPSQLGSQLVPPQQDMTSFPSAAVPNSDPYGAIWAVRDNSSSRSSSLRAAPTPPPAYEAVILDDL